MPPLQIPTRMQWYLKELCVACGSTVVIEAETDSHKNIGAHFEAQYPAYFENTFTKKDQSYIPREFMNFSPAVIRRSEATNVLAGVSVDSTTSSEELVLLALCAARNNWQLDCGRLQKENQHVCESLIKKSGRAQCQYWIRKAFPLVKALHDMCLTLTMGHALHIQEILSSHQSSCGMVLTTTLRPGKHSFKGSGIVPAFALWNVLMRYLEARNLSMAFDWEYAIVSIHIHKPSINFRAILPKIIGGLSMDVSAERNVRTQVYHAYVEIRDDVHASAVKSLYFADGSNQEDNSTFSTHVKVQRRNQIARELVDTVDKDLQQLIDSHHRMHVAIHHKEDKPTMHQKVQDIVEKKESEDESRFLQEYTVLNCVMKSIKETVKSDIPHISDSLILDPVIGYTLEVSRKENRKVETLVTVSGGHNLPLGFMSYFSLHEMLDRKWDQMNYPALQLHGVQNFIISCAANFREKNGNSIKLKKQKMQSIANCIACIYGLKSVFVLNGQKRMGYTASAYVAQISQFDSESSGMPLNSAIKHDSKRRLNVKGPSELRPKVEGIGYGCAESLTDAIENLLIDIAENLHLQKIREKLSLPLLDISACEAHSRGLILPKGVSSSESSYIDPSKAILLDDCPLECMRREAAIRFNEGSMLTEKWDGTTARLTSADGVHVFAFRPPTGSPVTGLLSCYLNLLERNAKSGNRCDVPMMIWTPQNIRPYYFQYTPIDHLMYICEVNFGLKVCVYAYLQSNKSNNNVWISEVYLSTDLPTDEEPVHAIWLASAFSSSKRDSRNQAALRTLLKHFPGSVYGGYTAWLSDCRYNGQTL